MRFGYAERCLDHDTGPRHPETPDRLRAIRQRLEELHGGNVVEPDAAEREAIEAVHDPTYVDELEEFAADGGGAWDSDTVISPESFDAALASAGLAVWAARNAQEFDASSTIPFAIGRPPGHHAVADNAMGFCLFNNVAVAAQAARDTGQAETVAILDWDVHHGNGTEAMFLDRADVAYASIHEEGLYPGTGDIDELGTDDGEGYTLNVPLPSGAENGTYLRAMATLIEPWLGMVEPDLLLVSAGFDAHRHDPISRMAVTTEGFGAITRRILEWAAPRTVPIGFVLEGGYGLDTLADGVAMVQQVCGGYDPIITDPTVRDIDEDRIEAVRRLHELGS